MPSPKPTPMPIFDGHNDVLLRLWRHQSADPVRAFLDGGRKGQLDLPMARAGGFAGGFFAMFVPSPTDKPKINRDGPGLNTEVGAPMPPPPDLADAQAATFTMASILMRIEREAADSVRICRNVADIRHCIDNGVIAAVLHIEGAEAIDAKLETLDVLHQAGLR